MDQSHPQKAYKNPVFLNSPDARLVRILAEYLEPRQRLRKAGIKDTIVFFGSARAVSREVAEERMRRISSTSHTNDEEIQNAKHLIRLSEYYEDARLLAHKLTRWSMDLRHNQRFIVCSGGGGGIMEAANRGAAEAGGTTIGMNISIPHEQEINPFISDGLSFEFHYFFMRKFWFIYLAKALVVFPGGFGTMDELFEVVTLIQTQKIKKHVPILIYGEAYWREVFHIDSMLDLGTIDEADADLIHFASDVDEAFAYLKHELSERFLKKRKRRYWYL